MLDEISIAVLGALSVPVIIKPLFRLWVKRNYVNVSCHMMDEAERVVKRVWAYTEMEPNVETVWPSIGTPYWVIEVPRIMLAATRFDESIRRLKEPLNV